MFTGIANELQLHNRADGEGMRQSKGRRMRFVMGADADYGGRPPPEPVRQTQIDPTPEARPVRLRQAAQKPQCLHRQSGLEHATTSRTPALPVTLDQLMFSERFMVWSARFWTTLNSHEHKSLNPLADAFRIAKIPGALGPFDAVMTVLTMKSARTLEFQAQRCGCLSTDEKRLLFLTGAKPGPMRDAVSSHLLRCQGTVLLRPLLAQLGDELDGAGLRPLRRLWDFPEVMACAELFPALDL